MVSTPQQIHVSKMVVRFRCATAHYKWRGGPSLLHAGKAVETVGRRDPNGRGLLNSTVPH